MEKIDEILTRGVENIYPDRESLKKVLLSGKKIKLYCGYDPTAPTLHIGNAISLRKMAQFQAIGCQVIMLIGDFTGMIGDPDKMELRKKLTREETLKNSKNYKKQAGKILDFDGPNPAQIKYNSEWNDKLDFPDLIELSSHFTVGQIMVRDMFQKRIEKKKPIYLHEFLYPVVQAYDSVVMDVDLEIGGNDQTFNMLCGRHLMQSMKNKEKFVLTMKLLEDSSGEKMGKTMGNMVSLNDEPAEMFGKIMSWSDGLIVNGFELCTDVSMEEIREIEEQMKDGKMNPRDAKARLAKEIVSLHYDKDMADEAEKEFESVFKEKKDPDDMPAVKIKEAEMNIIDLLIESKTVSSRGEAKRLVEQGAVKIDHDAVEKWDEKIAIKKGMVIQVGKRKFAKVD